MDNVHSGPSTVEPRHGRGGIGDAEGVRLRLCGDAFRLRVLIAALRHLAGVADATGRNAAPARSGDDFGPAGLAGAGEGDVWDVDVRLSGAASWSDVRGRIERLAVTAGVVVEAPDRP